MTSLKTLMSRNASFQKMTYPDPTCNIQNPTVPFWGKLSKKLDVDTMIWIKGFIPSGANRFALNLTTSQSEYSDLALHFNPRFDQKVVVRNTRNGVHWGKEEKLPNMFPFRTGQEFEMMILTDVECFKIAVNRRHFVDYNHRIAYNLITHYYIEGNIHIKQIQIIRPGHHMSDHPDGIGFPGPILPIDRRLQPVYNPEVPFIYPLNDLKPGTKVYISGHPSIDNFYRFEINFLFGPKSSKQNYALHLNPRSDQRTIVCNSYMNGSWGKEQRENCQPFESGVFFDLLINIDAQYFQIALNNQHLLNYPHRVMPLSKVNALEIVGHVSLSYVSIE